jgi:hypothetical protein
MDLVPYFQQDCPPAEIMRWIPALTQEEILLAEKYYREHKDELDEKDRHVREHREEQIRLQHRRFPPKAETPEQRVIRLRQLLHQRRQEKNGEGDPR